MRKKKLIILFIFSTILLNSVTFLTIGGATSRTLTETKNEAQDRNNNIVETFLDKARKSGNGGIYGQYWSNSESCIELNPNAEEKSTTLYSLENAYALPALQNYFKAQGVSAADIDASNIKSQVDAMYHSSGAAGGYLFDIDNSGTSSNEKSRDTFEQFAILDLISEYCILKNDANIYTSSLIPLYNSLMSWYKANNSLSGIEGGFWPKLNGFSKDTLGPTYCLANTSLMAATAISRFYKTAMLMPGDDDSDKTLILNEAEQAIAFVQDNCNVGGYITEDTDDNTNIIYALTQGFALNAYAMLYEVTGKMGYLTKAEALLRNTINILWYSGLGGFMQSYNLTSGEVQNSNKHGYSNAIIAQGCMELFKVSGNTYYFDIAAEIMNFMYNVLWVGTDITTDNNGYVECCNKTNGLIAIVNDTDVNKYHKGVKTNMIALKVNADIVEEIKPFYIKYMMEIAIGCVIGAAVITFVVLLIRRRSIGRALPKVVKGLLGEDED